MLTYCRRYSLLSLNPFEFRAWFLLAEIAEDCGVVCLNPFEFRAWFL